ncbi:MAG: FAD-dependent oxidoreductase, partial [Eubacteriales bacterium]|nr:FAD-dependent oxidoreductase [Eubacteriales bacterium]
MSEKIIVVGVNHAGTACTKQILTLNPGADVTVIDKNNNISFLGCGMALWIGNQITKSDGLFYSDKTQLESLGAKVMMETEVTDVDYDQKKVVYKAADGTVGELQFDKLVLAVGSSPIMPPIKGMDLKYVQKAKLFQDAQLAVDEIKNDDSIKTVTVVGAGYIGAELAEAYRRVGKEVILIDALDRILGTHFDRDFSDIMAARLESEGIKLHLGEKVQEFVGT